MSRWLRPWHRPARFRTAVSYTHLDVYKRQGLTSGVSGTVNVISHLALIMTMFIGRVGPVSFALTLAMRGGHRGDSEVLPTANLLVG